MLSRLRIQNFKSLRDVEMEFGDLTLLWGQNNSGKSATLEALMYYKEAAKCQALSTADIGDVEYVGYDFSQPSQLFHKNDNYQAESLTIEPVFDFTHHDLDEKLLTQLQAEGFTSPELGIEATFFENDLEQNVRCSHSEGDYRPVAKTEEGSSGARAEYLSPFGEDGSFQASNNGLLQLEEITSPSAEELYESMEEVISRQLGSLFYITDSRDIGKWSADPEKMDFVGHNGEDTVSMLHGLRDDPDAFELVCDAMKQIAEDTRTVEADLYKSDTRVEIVDDDTGLRFNVVSSGSGFRRLLPIIVQIAAMDEGGTLLLEEPEISVFPKTQEKFLRFLVEIMEEKNIQVIMSTHSIPFVWKLQDQVESDLGQALQFTKSGGETQVESKPIDRIEDAEMFGGWE